LPLWVVQIVSVVPVTFIRDEPFERDLWKPLRSVLEGELEPRDLAASHEAAGVEGHI
jgi:hypothetical protein